MFSLRSSVLLSSLGRAHWISEVIPNVKRKGMRTISWNEKDINAHAYCVRNIKRCVWAKTMNVYVCVFTVYRWWNKAAYSEAQEHFYMGRNEIYKYVYFAACLRTTFYSSTVGYKPLGRQESIHTSLQWKCKLAICTFRTRIYPASDYAISIEINCNVEFRSLGTYIIEHHFVGHRIMQFSLK